MTKGFLAAAALMMLTAPSIASAQDDDWEFQEDPARKLSVAAVRYEGGQMIVLQCEDGRLRLAVTGLPQSDAQIHLTGTRADGRSAEQVWAPIAPGVYRSASPGRDARFLRGGGVYAMRAGPDATTALSANFDLPSESENLDRVLTACGWALEDDRDLLEEAEEVQLDPPRRGRGPDAWPYRPPANPEHEVSCIVRGMRLRDCRADHPAYVRNDHVRSLIRSTEGRKVYVVEGVDASATEGKVFHVIASNMLLLVALSYEPL